MEKMSIVKIKISMPEAVRAIKKFKENRASALNALNKEAKSLIKKTVEALMDTEMDIFLGRPEQAENKRNGYKTKDYTFKGIGTVRVQIPRDRKSQFKSAVIPSSERIDPRIKQDMAVLHLAGISDRTLGMISRRILGIEVSKDSVARSLGLIEKSALKWLERPLTDKYWALYVDGTNFKVQRRGSTERDSSRP